ncbi:hypothetical protein EG329_007227 [Mollisiaceae sp. DMI_Dod_QoI]|nr:hypothetical protein EG329_007227 [Helotiales sp. DMI_Dod_QoI]
MSTSTGLDGIDMNNPANLEFFSEILLFKNDWNREEVTFMHRSNAEQRILQSIAHTLGLVYEYSAKIVRISRPDAFEPSSTDPNIGIATSNFMHLFDMNDHASLGVICHSSSAMQDIGAQSDPEATIRSMLNNDPTMINYETLAQNLRTVDGSGILARDESVIEDMFGLWTTPVNTGPVEERVGTMDLLATQNTALSQASVHFENWQYSDNQKCNMCGNISVACVCLTSYPQQPASGDVCPHRSANNPLLEKCIICFPADAKLTENDAIEVQKESESKPTTSGAISRRLLRKRKNSERSPSPEFALPTNIARPYQYKTSENARKREGSMETRRGSVHSGGSPGYKEIVFDSKSVYSESQVSVGSANSAGSGRRGPLSRLARAGMNAVKKVGACWRCKILKKPCDTYNPCALCPKRGGSNWEGVGCKRGDFQLPSFWLCRCSFARLSKDREDIRTIEAKIRSLRLTSNADSWPGKDGSNVPELSDEVRIEENSVRQEFYKNLNSAPIVERSPTTLAQLVPLEQCGLAIIRNFLQCPLARRALEEKGSLDELTRLLPFAIAYQAEHQENQLIAQSLICLRTCAETLRAKASGLLDTRWHSACESWNCKVECIVNLNVHLGLYARELSQVFFKKENLRQRGSWWLSVFYSFCIQSYVRRALVELTKDMEILNSTDICTAYEAAIWPDRRSKATKDAPAQLKAGYALFCHGVEQELEPRNTSLFIATETAATRWRNLSSAKREWSLREALLMSVSYLNEKLSKGGQAQNPLKSSRAKFDSMLNRSKLSAELIADLVPKAKTITMNVEAGQYLYLPVRLFIALHGITFDPIYPTPSEGSALEPGIRQRNIDAAREAVGASSWNTNGIQSSCGYLRVLFQDDGRTFKEVSAEDAESLPDPCLANLEGRCAVCMNHVHTDDEITVLPCSHWFHETCVVAWLEEVNTCPSCQAVVYNEPQPQLETLSHSQAAPTTCHTHAIPVFERRLHLQSPTVPETTMVPGFEWEPGPWSPAVPTPAQSRKRMLFDEIPDLKQYPKDRNWVDKLQEELEELEEKAEEDPEKEIKRQRQQRRRRKGKLPKHAHDLRSSNKNNRK